jgi:hypothetical protein
VIKSISGGNGIVVDSGYTTMPYINQNNNNPMQGMLRISGSDLQVFDGSTWIHVGGGYPSVSLNGSAQAAVNWAMKKQQEEQELAELCKQHPGVAEAYERLQILKALTKSAENKSDSNT